MDWSYATTNSSLARTVFASSCTQCGHFLTFDIDEVNRKREHYVGGRLETTSSQVQPNDAHAGATAVIDLHVLQAPFRLVSPSGATVDQSKQATTATFRTWLRWDGKWVVVDWKTAVTK